MKSAKSLIKETVLRLVSNDYHSTHKKSAKRILKSIESEKGITNPKFIKLADEYAKDVFGWIGFAPWLYVYSAIAGNFKEGWIPDNYYGRIVVPKIKGSYGKISDLKALSGKLFDKNIFPDIIYYVNGLWFSPSFEIIHEADIEDILFKDSNTAVFKIDNSIQGRGVYFFTKNSFNIKQIKSLGNGVFQSYIDEHDFFAQLMPNSVATLRITTVIENNGNISARASYLRIGRDIDTHVKSASHIRVPVNLATGRLSAAGYLTNWTTVNKHPDTNISFAEKEVPALIYAFPQL